MRKLIAAMLMALCVAHVAEADELSPRESLAQLSPTALKVLEAMEAERGLPYSDNEIREVARSSEFERRWIEAMKQQRMQRETMKIFRA
ncbi:TPA: hypothetical protein L4559_003485 [Pseudomonas aeruginosa]|nr:hypothetical protein [Pseudomonas aeruginosa]